jgi:hypothetical protein
MLLDAMTHAKLLGMQPYQDIAGRLATRKGRLVHSIHTDTA